jgi:hypothetical protein
MLSNPYLFIYVCALFVVLYYAIIVSSWAYKPYMIEIKLSIIKVFTTTDIIANVH